MTEHYITINELCSSLETHEETGLVEELAHLKFLNYGPNKLTGTKALPWLLCIIESFIWIALASVMAWIFTKFLAMD